MTKVITADLSCFDKCFFDINRGISNLVLFGPVKHIN